LDRIVNYRKYKPGDDETIVETLQASFPGWRSNIHALEHWRWKYLSSPLGALILITEVDGIIAGVNHFLVLNVKVNDSILRTQWGDDLSVLPEYRSLGLWNGMRDARRSTVEYSEAQFTYSVSTNPLVVESWRKRGKIIFSHSVKYMIRVKDLKLHLEKRPVDNPMMARLGVSLLKGLNKITPKRSAAKSSEYGLVEVDFFDERVDHFWDTVKASYSFIVERKKEYLNWRSMEQPWLKFKRILALDGEGLMVGYAVLKVDMLDEYHEGEIVDLLTLPGRGDVTESLIKASCEFFDESGLNIAYFRCAKGHQHQNNAKGFFVEVPNKDLYLTYEILAQSEGEIKKLEDSSDDQISLNYLDTF
jgi:hypothetical protein